MPEPRRRDAPGTSTTPAIRWEWVVTVVILLFGAAPPLSFTACIGLISACIANKRGRSFIAWWVYGSVLAPVAIPHILMSGRADKRPCNFCKEPIHMDAVICPHCSSRAERVAAL